MPSPDILSFTAATEKRRSRRLVEATSPVSDTVLVDLAQAALLNVPSAFNSQTTRLTVLLHNEHRKLWTITGDALLAEIGEGSYNARSDHVPSFKEKIGNYRKAYGTILFWDDLEAVFTFKNRAPELYQDKCDEWAAQSNGMHQYHLWTALEAFGLGASVQHYNPLIDDHVRKMWNIPKEWALRAQMVFGTPLAGASLPDKVQKLPMGERLNVFGVAVGESAKNSM